MTSYSCGLWIENSTKKKSCDYWRMNPKLFQCCRSLLLRWISGWLSNYECKMQSYSTIDQSIIMKFMSELLWSRVEWLDFALVFGQPTWNPLSNCSVNVTPSIHTMTEEDPRTKTSHNIEHWCSYNEPVYKHPCYWQDVTRILKSVYHD